MRLQAPDNQEIIIGGGKEQMFGIDTSTPIIFEILRNKMYSNKIGAVAREVASNSRDANRESGTDQPVQIEFTNDSAWMLGDVSVIFRDFGVGISPDRMENVFLKYAASTKRDSDTQTGGFGLGAKTPFAYTDSFIIRTVNEGTEYVYNAIIDKTGNGKMILLSEEPTDKPSGTEIIIPILSSRDRAEFEKEIYKATSYWTNVEYLNFSSRKSEVKYVVNEKDYRITQWNGWATYVGLVDGIPYEIRPTNMVNIPGYTVMFNLDLPEITINANRESLQYDEKTKNHVDAKFEMMVEHLKERIEGYLSDNATYKEAFIKQKSIKSNNYTDDFLNLLYNFKEAKLFGINYNVMFNGEEVKALKLKFHTVDIAKYDSWSERMKYTPASVNLDLPLVYLDAGRISVAKNRHLRHFLFVKPIKGNTEEAIKEEFDKLMEITEGEYEKYSEVKLPPGVSATPVKKDFVTFKVRDEKKFGKEIRFDRISKKVNTDKNICFVPLYSITKNLYFNDDRLKIVKHVLKIDQLYFINEASFYKHLKPAGYKTLDELFVTVDLKRFSKYLDIVKIKDALDDFPKIIVDNFPELLPKSYAYIASQDVKIPEGFKSIDWERLGVKQSAFNYEGVYEKFKKQTDLNYPLLRTYIRSSRDSEERTIKNIRNYVNISNCSKR